MNVCSECVDNFHYYNQLELLLLILVCIHMSCFIYFGKNAVPIGHGNSFLLVLESHGKVMENNFRKSVVTLQYVIVLAVPAVAVCLIDAGPLVYRSISREPSLTLRWMRDRGRHCDLVRWMTTHWHSLVS